MKKLFEGDGIKLNTKGKNPIDILSGCSIIIASNSPIKEWDSDYNEKILQMEQALNNEEELNSKLHKQDTEYQTKR